MPTYKFNISLKGTGETPQDAYKKALEVFSKDPSSYMELAIDFSPLFHFAEKEEKEVGIKMLSFEEAEQLFYRVHAKIYGAGEASFWPDSLDWSTECSYPREFIIQMAKVIAQRDKAGRDAFAREMKRLDSLEKKGKEHVS